MIVAPHSPLLLGGREKHPVALKNGNHGFDLFCFPALVQKGEDPLSSLNLLLSVLA